METKVFHSFQELAVAVMHGIAESQVASSINARIPSFDANTSNQCPCNMRILRDGQYFISYKNPNAPKEVRVHS